MTTCWHPNAELNNPVTQEMWCPDCKMVWQDADTAMTPADIEALAACPKCGSDDLGFFGDTEERTESDIIDYAECTACKWTAVSVELVPGPEA